MNLEIGDKNPISVLNEFSLKTNSKIDFEWTSLNGEFYFKVKLNSMEIGEGNDKKKQKAKSKAAESAISYINLRLNEDNFECKLKDLTKSIKRNGEFKLTEKKPFNYQYYLDSLLVSSASSKVESLAKEECAKKAFTKLQEIVKANSEESKESPKLQDDKGTQVEKIYCRDPRIFAPKNSFDQRYQLFFENKFSSFEVSQRDLIEINGIDSEISSISKILGLRVVPVGSLCLKIVRNSKLVLDYVLLVPNATESVIEDIFKVLELARLNFLDSKEKNTRNEGAKISMSVEHVENTINMYSKLSYFRFRRESLLVNLFVYDSDGVSLVHYRWVKSDRPFYSKIKTCCLLRHWRHALKIDIPPELLDLLVENFVTEDTPCGLGFRIVCEKIASGIFLPGALSVVQDTCHEKIVTNWSLRFRYEAMKEAGKCLVAISQGEIEQFLQ